MTRTTDTTSEPIRIHEGTDGTRPVVLHPDNDDLFVQTGRQVIEACRLNISIEIWVHEVNSMFAWVADWAKDRPQRVQACFATPRPTKLLLLITPVGQQFDFDLADELASVSRQLARDFKVGLVEVLQVPHDELDRFVDPAEARRIYAQPG